MKRIALATTLVVAAGITAIPTPASAKPDPVTLTIVGPFFEDEPTAIDFEAELAAFTTANRVEVTYERYDGEADLRDRLNGPNPPDLVLTPTPIVLGEMAPALVDLSEFVNPTALRRDFGDHLIDIATVDGAIVGAPVKADLKSLVWYQPATFEANGYSVPESFDELVALSDQMVADGATPWCNYMESGFATGWVGTDWVEDLVLGAEGPAVYDGWVDHSVLFVDPRIETAFERYQQMIDTPGYVFDRANMLNESFFFNTPPLEDGDCLMHKQAAFYRSFIDGFGFDLDDYATFDFPAVDPAFADGAMGSANHVAATNDRNETRQLVRFMLSQRFGRAALADSETGWIMPNTRFDTSRYGDDLTRSFAATVQTAIEADQFRFDASDIMPPEVGSGTFWFGITELVAGAKTIPQVLTDIDASWPI